MEKKAMVTVLSLSLILGACEKNGTEGTEEPEFYADVYVLKKKTGGEIKYAPAFFVYSINDPVDSVTVTPPGGAGEPFQLAASSGSFNTFLKEPSIGDFLNMPPSEGDYLFNIFFGGNGNEQKTDSLANGNLGIPEIKSYFYQQQDQSMNIQWNAAPGADGYIVKLLDTGGEIVFMSFTLPSGTEEFNISDYTGSFSQPVYFDEDYILQVESFAYESGAYYLDDKNGYYVGDEPAAYNIREVSLDEMQIVWEK